MLLILGLATDQIPGLLSSTMGNLDQALGPFGDVLSLCHKAGYRPELAWTRCDYSDTLLQRNSPGDREKAISAQLGMRTLMELAAR